MKLKTIIAAIIALAAIGGSFYYLSGRETNNGSTEVVARVNGQEITRGELNNAENQLSTAQGLDLATLDESTRGQFQSQVLENLISNSLVNQAGIEAGIEVTEEDVDTQMNTIKSQFQDSSEFALALSSQKLTEAQLRDDLSRDLVIQAYLEQKLNLSAIEVTEKEISDLYASESELSEELPPLSEISEQIKAYLIQQKQQELILAHIEELKATAEIEILI